MGKIDYRTLSEEQQNELQGVMIDTMERSGLNAEGKSLLSHLLTKSEKVMIARRILVANRLLSNCGFEEIRDEIGVGFSTIQMVDKALEESLPGYRHELPELLKKKNKKRRKPIDPTLYDPASFKSIRKRYPAHFLLFNILLGDPFEN